MRGERHTDHQGFEALLPLCAGRSPGLSRRRMLQRRWEPREPDDHDRHLGAAYHDFSPGAYRLRRRVKCGHSPEWSARQDDARRSDSAAWQQHSIQGRAAERHESAKDHRAGKHRLRARRVCTGPVRREGKVPRRQAAIGVGLHAGDHVGTGRSGDFHRMAPGPAGGIQNRGAARALHRHARRTCSTRRTATLGSGESLKLKPIPVEFNAPDLTVRIQVPNQAVIAGSIIKGTVIFDNAGHSAVSAGCASAPNYTIALTVDHDGQATSVNSEYSALNPSAPCAGRDIVLEPGKTRLPFAITAKYYDCYPPLPSGQYRIDGPYLPTCIRPHVPAPLPSGRYQLAIQRRGRSRGHGRAARLGRDTQRHVTGIPPIGAHKAVDRAERTGRRRDPPCDLLQYHNAGRVGTRTRSSASNTNVRSVRRYLTTAIALIIVTAGCSSSHTTRPASSSETTTTTIDQTVTTTPRLPAGVTAEQLNAHLGVGVPKGWGSVDEGNARVWVPSRWIPAAQGTCFTDAAYPGVVSIGGFPSTTCDHPGHIPIQRQEVVLIPTSQKHTGHPSLTVHGYPIYDANSAIRREVGWNFYDVPKLGVSIATRGTMGSRILGTLAPSARNVTLAFADEPAPNDWRAVDAGGVSLSVPRSWPVITPTGIECDWQSVFPNGEPTLRLIKPHIETTPRCPPPSAFPEDFHDGVYLYLPPDNRLAPRPSARPIATLRQRTTTIRVYADRGNPNALDLFVRRTGSPITHVLTLGLGRDGRIAGGVLASIRAVT